ncbi:MAG: SMP-30/gluconolactonase/LRE family protein [Betaproteobacteria bacterium]
MTYYGAVEGTGFEVLEAQFRACLVSHARVERLWTGARWCEGPAWFGGGRYLVFSDIPNDRMLRYDECDGRVSVFRQPSHHSNGNTVDREGRLVTCEHRTRRVTRTEHDGTVTVLADRFGNRRFNSPNDIVVRSDGSIWFTDPDYGIRCDYEGARAESEIGSCNVYRIDPATAAVTIVADDFDHPNGLAFSPDERALYVADSGFSEGAQRSRHIRRFDVRDGGTLGASEVFATCTAGLFDGFRVDRDGRLWTSTAEGVECYRADGQLIGRVRIPEIVANLAFGARERNHLFICATTSLYSLYLRING